MSELKSGDIVQHKLTNEKLVVLYNLPQLDVREKSVVCRDKDYGIKFCYPNELCYGY